MSAPQDSAAPARGPNCFSCKHFAVSWDAALPYSCRLMGFKSRGLPAIEVLRADGVFCRGFAAKGAATPAPPPEPMVGRLPRAAAEDAFEVLDKKPLVARKGRSVWSA